jgi:hypothetical protein
MIFNFKIIKKRGEKDDLATFNCPLSTNIYYNEQSIKCNFSLSNTFYDNASVELKYGYGNSDIYQFTSLIFSFLLYAFFNIIFCLK